MTKRALAIASLVVLYSSFPCFADDITLSDITIDSSSFRNPDTDFSFLPDTKGAAPDELATKIKETVEKYGVKDEKPTKDNIVVYYLSQSYGYTGTLRKSQKKVTIVTCYRTWRIAIVPPMESVDIITGGGQRTTDVYGSYSTVQGNVNTVTRVTSTEPTNTFHQSGRGELVYIQSAELKSISPWSLKTAQEYTLSIDGIMKGNADGTITVWPQKEISAK